MRFASFHDFDGTAGENHTVQTSVLRVVCIILRTQCVDGDLATAYYCIHIVLSARRGKEVEKKRFQIRRNPILT